MARLIAEDFALYMMAFYIVCSVIFQVGIFNTFLPGQRYNTSTSSFEAWDTTPDPSIFGNAEEYNATMGQYENISSVADPGAMLDPIKIMNLIGFYAGFLYNMVSSTMLYAVLTPFIGAAWASKLTLIINLIITLVFIRIATGRIRWD